jgi:hypothetical protein
LLRKPARALPILADILDWLNRLPSFSRSLPPAAGIGIVAWLTTPIRRLGQNDPPFSIVAKRVGPELSNTTRLDFEQLIQTDWEAALPLLKNPDRFCVLESSEDELLFLLALDHVAPDRQGGRDQDVHHRDENHQDDQVVAG